MLGRKNAGSFYDFENQEGRIGKMLLEKISVEGWGAKTINKLAKDLESSFPDTDGFSLRNLQYMRKFAKSYPDSNCATAVAQIPWGHNIALLEKVDSIEKRLWYAQQAVENGWSRSVLVMWVESDIYSRQRISIYPLWTVCSNTQMTDRQSE